MRKIDAIEELQYCAKQAPGGLHDACIMAIEALKSHDDNLSYIKELKADNERLLDMWVKAVSDLSKCQAENVKYKRMLDNAYEMIGKITDRYG